MSTFAFLLVSYLKKKILPLFYSQRLLKYETGLLIGILSNKNQDDQVHN